MKANVRRKTPNKIQHAKKGERLNWEGAPATITIPVDGYGNDDRLNREGAPATITIAVDGYDNDDGYCYGQGEGHEIRTKKREGDEVGGDSP